jgi:hypothetical protein
MPGMVKEKQTVWDLLRWALRHRMAFSVATSIIMVCLVGAGTMVVFRYQPIVLAVGPAEPRVVNANGTSAVGFVKEVPGAALGGRTTLTVTLTEPNMTVSVSNMLSSHGKFSVDILGVDTPFGARAAKVRVLMGDAHGSPANRPFRRFTLHPGDLRLLTIVLRPKICPGPGNHDDVAIADGEDVTYRFLGVTHRAQVTFHGAGYGITGIASC